MHPSSVNSVTTRGVWPSTRVGGALPRRSLPGQACPFFSEHIKVIPRSDWDEYAADLNDGLGLRPFVRTVLDQDGVGSCAAEATTGALMIGRDIAGLDHVTLNPWFMYRVTSGGRDNGSAIDDNLAFAREHGCAPEALHPRSLGWRAQPSEQAIEAAKQFRIVEFYDITSIDEMVSALLLGYPVVYGAAGHAVCKIRHLNDRQGEDVNSWGTDWGDRGFGVWANYAAIDMRYGAFAVRTTE